MGVSVPEPSRRASPSTSKSPGSAKNKISSVPKPRATTLASKASGDDAAMQCESVQDWLRPECWAFKGMRVVRPQRWDHIQSMIDKFYDSGAFGPEQTLVGKVALEKSCAEDCADKHCPATASDSDLRAAFGDVMDGLLKTPMDMGMPRELAEAIRGDALEIGLVVSRLLPTAPSIVLKVELIRENRCGRWHVDNYTSRAIVSYNCSATEYVRDDHVDFWQLENRGTNEQVVRDERNVCVAGVGDIMLMKGKAFPHEVNALVHRSPGLSLGADGNMLTRLLLKVDVPRT